MGSGSRISRSQASCARYPKQDWFSLPPCNLVITIHLCNVATRADWIHQCGITSSMVCWSSYYFVAERDQQTGDDWGSRSHPCMLSDWTIFSDLVVALPMQKWTNDLSVAVYCSSRTVVQAQSPHVGPRRSTSWEDANWRRFVLLLNVHLGIACVGRD